MKSIFPLLIANLKKRKAQSLITVIIIAVAAIMFTTAATVATSLKKPFEEMYQKLNASQLLILNQGGIYDTQSVAAWWEKQDGVTVQTFKYHITNDRLVYKGQVLNEGMVFFAEKPDQELKQDKLAILEGEQKSFPGNGEVWVCRSFADKRHIAINDTLDVSAKGGIQSMKITAIVADAQFGSPSMGVLRMWVAPGALDSLFNSGNQSGDFIGLRFDDYSKRTALWTAFEKDLGKAFTADMFDYDLIASAYLTQYQIMGAILSAFAIILLIIAICIIAFTISAAVTADVKTIGILKSQGYTPQAMTWLYALQYMLLAVIAVPIGIFLSSFVVKATTDMQTSSMGVTAVQLSLLIPGLISFAIIVVFVGLVSFMTARKAGRLKPVAAIREELSEAKQIKTISFQKTSFIPVPLLVAFRHIFTQKWQSLLLLMGSIALSGVFTFSVNLYHTFDRMYDVANEWGFDSRDDTIAFKEGADRYFQQGFANMLEKDGRIRNYIAVANRDLTARIEGKDENTYKDVTMALFDGDIASIGALTLEGKNPLKDNEIAISVNISKQFGIVTGDYVTVNIAGKKLDLLVTGVYQTTNRMGWGVKAQGSVMEMVIPGFKLQNYAIVFNNQTDRESFVKEYREKYSDQLDIQPYEETLGGFLYGTKVGINSFVIMLGTIFTLIMLIVIFNSTLIGIYREKRVYGILKSMGLTPVQVRMTIVWRTLILTVVGVMIGIPMTCWGEIPLMNGMLAQMGMVRFPMMTTISGMLAVIPACLLVGFASSWIPSKKIHHISPRNLIIE